MKKTMFLTSFIVLSMTSTAIANEGHHDGMDGNKMNHHDKGAHGMKGHGEHETMDMDKNSKMFLVKKEVDGYSVSFHVMPSKESMGHGGSHSLMVKIERNGETVSDVVINSKVFHPNNSTESKMLMKMGDWYMAGYDLGHEGKHGIMILFKTADGQKHKASVYYKEEK